MSKKDPLNKALAHIKGKYSGKAWCKGVDTYGPDSIVVYYVDSKTCPSWYDTNNKKITDYAGISIRWVKVQSS